MVISWHASARYPVVRTLDFTFIVSMIRGTCAGEFMIFAVTPGSLCHDVRRIMDFCALDRP